MRQTPRRTMCAQSLTFQTRGARKKSRVSSESQHLTSAKQSGHERGDARQRIELYGFMDSILLLFVVVILFVLWLVRGDAQHT
jgi:hypothetical protein